MQGIFELSLLAFINEENQTISPHGETEAAWHPWG